MSRRPRLQSRKIAALLAGALALGAVPSVAGQVLADPASPGAAASAAALIGSEPYRPHLHYTPQKNWVNDPNGMVYYKGVYHLFYQHNPFGDQWGNMSWGHATSTDLLNWEEQPVAIPNTETEYIFSGSVVIDRENTTGFGTADNPAMVAVYTSQYRNDPVYQNREAQSLAYSTDEGATWTKYDGNPVDDRNRNDYRDPKVFWYGDKATGYWVMAAVEADASRVILNKSDDLKTWTYLSTFTSGTVGSFWECPDFYPIALDGDSNDVKWVMALSTSGSLQSYLVGEFDGTTFTEDERPQEQAPAGDLLWGFDGGDYEGWTVQNDQSISGGGPFGESPAAGAVSGQRSVTGFIGDGLVNSYLGTDVTVGSLVSPDFTIDSDYLSFLTGGGNHPREDGTGSGLAPASSTPIFDFEVEPGTTLADQGWTGTGGLAASAQPATPRTGANVAWGYGGNGYLSTFYSPNPADSTTGTLTSPSFEIDSPYIDLKVGGGGRTGDALAVQLLVDGQVVKSETGKNNHLTDWRSWDVSEYEGETAVIRVVDNVSDGWGAIWIDDVVAAGEPALPRSTETAVNLVVDGETVRQTPGPDNEDLNWQNWDLRDLAGKTAHIEIIDNNRGGYGHIMADQFIARDSKVEPTVRYDAHRLDFGTDNYAANSYNDAPDGKRIFVGWMGQAFSSPTSPWRGGMTLPRELELKTVAGVPMLVHTFPEQLADYEKDFDAYRVSSKTVDGLEALPAAARGTQQRIRVELVPGKDRSGVIVRGSSSEGTLIGYDPASGSVFIDRSNSGLDASDRFRTPSKAPVRVIDGRVTLDIVVDAGSVDVLVNGGEQAFSELIYPSARSTTVSLFSDDGDARFDNLSVTPLYSAMYDAGQVRLTETTTALSLSATSAQYRSKVVVATATVSGADAGTVEFLDGEKSLGIVAVDAGAARLTLPAALSVGAHPITARFARTETALGSEDSSTVTIVKAVVPSVKVTAPRFAKDTRPRVTVTVARPANGLYPTGKIGLSVNGTWVKTITLSAGDRGTRTVSLPRKYSKAISVVAKYSGNTTTAERRSPATMVRPR